MGLLALPGPAPAVAGEPVDGRLPARLHPRPTPAPAPVGENKKIQPQKKSQVGGSWGRGGAGSRWSWAVSQPCPLGHPGLCHVGAAGGGPHRDAGGCRLLPSPSVWLGVACAPRGSRRLGEEGSRVCLPSLSPPSWACLALGSASYRGSVRGRGVASYQTLALSSASRPQALHRQSWRASPSGRRAGRAAVGPPVCCPGPGQLLSAALSPQAAFRLPCTFPQPPHLCCGPQSWGALNSCLAAPTRHVLAVLE